jgi:hypothetical protein
MTQSRMLGRLLIAVGAAFAALALVAPLASATETKPGYERFAGCPSPAENPEVTHCVRTVVKSGHFQMGNKDVPIANPITLSGGLGKGLKGFFANSKGGLTPVKQLVPGGIIGLTGLDWLVNFLNLEALQLFAVTELVGVPTITGPTLTLPTRVHLINPVLGNNCYVGSPSNPVTLNLITGTTNPPPPNKPITGVEPTLSFGADGVLHESNGTFVDNSFAAPGASGCVLTLFGFIPISINGLVNSQSGLPAAAGTNETVQNFDFELVESKLVYP